MLNNFAEDPNEELPLPKCVFYTESEASKFLDYISDLTSRSKNSSFNIGLWFREFARIQGYNSLSKKKIKARLCLLLETKKIPNWKKYVRCLNENR